MLHEAEAKTYEAVATKFGLDAKLEDLTSLVLVGNFWEQEAAPCAVLRGQCPPMDQHLVLFVYIFLRIY